MKKEIKIPDIAENVETGLIAGILVKKGDKVNEEQAVVEVETDKATTDIPSPFSGIVDEIRVSEGDEVSVDQVIMIIEVENDKEEETQDDEEKKKSKEEKKEKEDSAKISSDEEKETEDYSHLKPLTLVYIDISLILTPLPS